MPTQLYFRQLLAGHDYARQDPIAQQMRNFTYFIGDPVTRQAFIVDPAYNPQELLDILHHDQMELNGILVTHHHPDHIGGSMMGFNLIGLAELLEHKPVPIHVNILEAPWVSRITGIALSELTTHHHGDTVSLGQLEIELLHTPGHTPGSQCFFLSNALITGDTLFIDGCGRTDFPGGDPEAMYHSLQHLACLPGNPTVFAGHWYSQQPHASLSEVQQSNYVYRAKNLAQWQQFMGSSS